MKAVGAAISICLLLAPSLHASRPRQSDVLRKISETAQKLRKLQPPVPDVAYRPPPRVKPLLAELRRDVRDLVSEALAASPPASTDSTRVQSEILTRLQESGVGIPGPLADRKLGTVDVTIERPARHPELLVAITKLGLPCSLDNSLYVFGQDRAGWNLVISLEAKDFSKRFKYLRKIKSIPLQGDITYAISPPDETGKWFLVAASVIKLCKHDWSVIEYEVVRPDASPYSPKILLDQGWHIWIPGGGPLLAVSRDRFRLVFDDDYWYFDHPLPPRAQVHRWSVVGDQVERIPPYVLYPRSFVEEWMDSEWEAVAPLTLPQFITRDGQWHSQLYGYGRKSRRPPPVGLDFVQPCPGPEKKWVIGSSTNPDNRPEDMPKEIFFTVFQIEDEFYMGEVGSKRPDGCPGEARPEGEVTLPTAVEP